MSGQLSWGFPIMLCMLAADLLVSWLLFREPVQQSCWVDVCSQWELDLHWLACRYGALKAVHHVLICCVPLPPDLAVKHPLKPTSLNTHCGSKTKTHSVVRWALVIYSLKELSLLDLWLSTFLSLHKHCRSCWLSRQSSDFSVTAAGRATFLSAGGCVGRNISFHLGHAGPPLDSVDVYISKTDADEDVWGNCFWEWDAWRQMQKPRWAEDEEGRGRMPWWQLQTSQSAWQMWTNTSPQQVGSPEKQTHFWREKRVPLSPWVFVNI